MKIVTIILTVFLIACNHQDNRNMNFFKKTDPADNFWNWFSKNQEKVYQINEKNSEQILDEVLGHIRKIKKGLSIEISISDSKGIRDFVISAEGDKTLFPIVQKIVEKAPKFEKWRIIAFRQRANENFTLNYQDLVLDPTQLFFHPIKTDSTLDIIVYGDGFKNQVGNVLLQHGLIMMDNLIGEYDCVMTVRYYDFKDLSEEANKTELLKLADLPKYIDDFKLNKK